MRVLRVYVCTTSWSRYDEPSSARVSPPAFDGGAAAAEGEDGVPWGGVSGGGAVLMRTVPVILGEHLLVCDGLLRTAI